MQPEMAGQVITPFMQYGFAGFAFLMLIGIGWFFNKALVIIAANTLVLEKLNERDKGQLEKIDEIRDMLLSRPCIANEK